MTIRALMVDVDGVLIVHPDRGGWSATLERDLGLPGAVLQRAFFAPHWDDVVHGRAALRERLAPVLAREAPHLTCDALIDYWFGRDAHVNQPLLDDLAMVRAGGLPVHLATVQEHERARYLWDVLGWRDRFDGLHYAADLGCSKPAPEFYRAVERRTGHAPGELFLLDDQLRNVEAARACGWGAAQWTGEMPLRNVIGRVRGAGIAGMRS